MIVFLIITNIMSLVIGALAHIRVNDVQKENINTLGRLCKHAGYDLESHRRTNETLDLICKYLKLGEVHNGDIYNEQ